MGVWGAWSFLGTLRLFDEPVLGNTRTVPLCHFLPADRAICGVSVAAGHLGPGNLVDRTAMWAGVGHQAEYALLGQGCKLENGLPYSN